MFNQILILLSVYFAITVRGESLTNFSDFQKCKLSHLGLEYQGDIARSDSGVLCQFWNAEKPVHKVDSSFTDMKFSDMAIEKAKNYCRNPNKNLLGPWCYTTDIQLIDDTCNVPLCRFLECKITGPGMEYAGNHSIASSRNKCKTWDKKFRKVKHEKNIIEENKFNKVFFPENSVSSAKKHCRNPDGDIGGPWCYVEDEESSSVVRKEYCDIPFCDDPKCLFLSKNTSFHSHYTNLDPSFSNLTFGIKLWDSDSFINSEARILLSVLSLPLSNQEIEEMGIGIEIFISNRGSALTVNNVETVELEESFDILKSTEYKYLSLVWHRGFVTLSVQGKIHSIFLSEYKIKNSLLKTHDDSFSFYSVRGTNILWNFPFCENDNCEIHTTTALEFTRFFPLNETATGYDIHFFVRAFHSTFIQLVPSPTISYPRITISFFRQNLTEMLLFAEKDGLKLLLADARIPRLIDYWTWSEFIITIFGDTVNVLSVKESTTRTILTGKDVRVRTMRWFSIASEDTVAHWTLFCQPSESDAVAPAWPPECALDDAEMSYKGTQWVTNEGYPCIPWSDTKNIPNQFQNVIFENETKLEAENYCRNLLKTNEGSYCFAIKQNEEVRFSKTLCKLRKCKSTECRMAGTGNDYVGKLNVTRSNRTCQKWTENTTHSVPMQYLNQSLYGDLTLNGTENYCRDPSRNIAGTWCYTTDPAVEYDLCDVRDCVKTEECTVMTRGNGLCQKKESSDGATFLYRSMWKFDKGKKLEVSIRVLKSGSCDNYLKEFVEVAGAWSSLGPTWSGLVRMWGMSLCNPTALILEHSPLGSLSEYLSQNTVQSVDLLEAASHLASALWHLEENGVVHGKIRCRKILVFCHNDDSFLVKLADPGIHVAYGAKDIYWIPVECYPNLELARRSHTADVWAFGTTLWELFMNGQSPPELNQIEAMRFHASGKRFAAPQDCPMDVYQLMRKCWDADPYRRIKPQTILRDINQLLYQVFNSRRKHPYATVFSKSFSDAGSVSAVSVATEDTLVSQQDELLSLTGQTELDNNSVLTFPSCDNDLPNTWLRSNSQDLENDEDAVSCDMSNILSSFNFSTPTTSLDSINSIPSIFELGADCNVVLQGRIGQGFYGEVYKGILERVGDKDAEPRQVAVKKLKTNTQNAGLQDFEREIAIMKRLKHPNIVEILGVLEELDVSLVMEYVPHGSLQNYLKIHKESLTIKQLLNYALDVTKGMDYLGQEHIVHRDLATRNLLVVDENHVKISDFGLAQVVGKNEYYILRTNRDLPIKWYALESLKDGKFSSKSDVWSFGVTMYEMFSLGEEPMLPMVDNANIEGQEQQILLNALESGARFPCPSICPQSVYVRIMYPCWKAIPNERPSFHQLSSDIQELLMQTN